VGRENHLGRRVAVGQRLHRQGADVKQLSRGNRYKLHEKHNHRGEGAIFFGKRAAARPQD
jgi:hypothetical protein